RCTSRSWPLRGRAARATGVRLRAVAAVLPAPGRSAAGPLGPRASASGRWPLYFPLLAAPRPGRSGHGLACRLALLAASHLGVEPLEEIAVVVVAGVGSGEQPVAEEDAAGPCVQAQRLQLVGHLR